MSTGDAMMEYVRALSEMLPGWNDVDASGASAAGASGDAASASAAHNTSMGPVSSTLYANDGREDLRCVCLSSTLAEPENVGRAPKTAV
jgi:hypothetical protein